MKNVLQPRGLVGNTKHRFPIMKQKHVKDDEIILTFDSTYVFVVTVIGNENEAGSSADLENLPDDLKEIVTCDNKAFAEEIVKWDRDLARKATGGGDADVTIVVDQKAGTSIRSFQHGFGYNMDHS